MPSSPARASGVRFESALLDGADLSGGRLEKLGLTDSRLVDCNLANVQARGADATRVAIERGRLTGIAFPEGTLQDVRSAAAAWTWPRSRSRASLGADCGQRDVAWPGRLARPVQSVAWLLSSACPTCRPN